MQIGQSSFVDGILNSFSSNNSAARFLHAFYAEDDEPSDNQHCNILLSCSRYIHVFSFSVSSPLPQLAHVGLISSLSPIVHIFCYVRRGYVVWCYRAL